MIKIGANFLFWLSSRSMLHFKDQVLLTCTEVDPRFVSLRAQQGTINWHLILVNSWASERFFPGGACRGFSQVFFQGGQKWWNLVFIPSKLKKQPFFANDFKNQGGQGPLDCGSGPHTVTLSRFQIPVKWFKFFRFKSNPKLCCKI